MMKQLGESQQSGQRLRKPHTVSDAGLKLMHRIVFDDVTAILCGSLLTQPPFPPPLTSNAVPFGNGGAKLGHGSGGIVSLRAE